MTGYHTRWVRPPEHADDPERIAIREALAFGKAVYDQRCALGLGVATWPPEPTWPWMMSSASKRAAPSPPSSCYGASPPLSIRTCG
jgi:hypothetical protein